MTDLVPDDEIAGILAGPAHPQETARGLVDRALDRGGKDNVTVVLADYALLEPGGQAPRHS